MDKKLLVKLLESVADGRVSVKDGAEKLRHIAYEDITYAHIDHHRGLCKGFRQDSTNPVNPMSSSRPQDGGNGRRNASRVQSAARTLRTGG